MGSGPSPRPADVVVSGATLAAGTQLARILRLCGGFSIAERSLSSVVSDLSPGPPALVVCRRPDRFAARALAAPPVWLTRDLVEDGRERRLLDVAIDRWIDEARVIAECVDAGRCRIVWHDQMVDSPSEVAAATIELLGDGSVTGQQRWPASVEAELRWSPDLADPSDAITFDPAGPTESCPFSADANRLVASRTDDLVRRLAAGAVVSSDGPLRPSFRYRFERDRQPTPVIEAGGSVRPNPHRPGRRC